MTCRKRKEEIERGRKFSPLLLQLLCLLSLSFFLGLIYLTSYLLVVYLFFVLFFVVVIVFFYLFLFLSSCCFVVFPFFSYSLFCHFYFLLSFLFLLQQCSLSQSSSILPFIFFSTFITITFSHFPPFVVLSTVSSFLLPLSSSFRTIFFFFNSGPIMSELNYIVQN